MAGSVSYAAPAWDQTPADQTFEFYTVLTTDISYTLDI